jgi:hypothetical protein
MTLSKALEHFPQVMGMWPYRGVVVEVVGSWYKVFGRICRDRGEVDRMIDERIMIIQNSIINKNGG